MHVSLLWADYCKTIQADAKKDLPYFFESALPVDKCLLAVTLAYRGANCYKSKKGHADATAEQTGCNIERIYQFANGTKCA